MNQTHKMENMLLRNGFEPFWQSLWTMFTQFIRFDTNKTILSITQPHSSLRIFLLITVEERENRNVPTELCIS